MLLAALLLQTVIVTCTGQYNRRTISSASVPLSKGGWKPVIGNSGLQSYGMLSTSPLHAPPISKYKLPVPVSSDPFASSSRPLVARDTKLTSIAQSYKPTTARNQAVNGPIHSYYNPFALPSTGLSHYKLVQNFPLESVVIRNPQYSYVQRPVYSKYPNQVSSNKFNQNLHNSMIQQLSNNQLNVVQPISFPYYHTTKNPHDLYLRPFDDYVRPTEHSLKAGEHKKPDTYKMEIFKPEVFKLTDSDTAPQIQQQVKTAQQTRTTSKPSTNGLQHYQMKDEKFPPIPPSILGTFNTFGVQSVKARDPTKQSYFASPPTKQTVFNSFSYAPSLNPFVTTTPRIKISPNQLMFGSFGNTFPQTTKQTNPFKVDPGALGKDKFKASPQDPFRKPVQFQQGLFENYHQPQKQNPHVTTFYPQTIQTPTASVTSYFNFNPSPQKHQGQTKSPFTATPSTSVIYGQNNYDYENNKVINQKILPTGNRPQAPSQFSFDTPQDIPTFSFELPKEKPVLESNTPTPVVPQGATYDVTESWGSDDIITHSPQNSWSHLQTNEETVSIQPNSLTHSKAHKSHDQSFKSSSDDTQTQVQEDYTIVSSEIPDNKGHENYLSYETDYGTATRRPQGDEYSTPQTVAKYKNKNYYKVTTSTYDEPTTHQKRVRPRPNKYGESKLKQTENKGGEHKINQQKDSEKDTLPPTLPPHKHFKRPQQQESTEKDKVRKRNKLRRRRPQQQVQKEDVSEKLQAQSTTESYITETEDTLSVKPRRPTYSKPKITTPTITTELSTSAVPTVAPTVPSIVKKKHSARKTTTSVPTEPSETTTSAYKNRGTTNSESSIMKITNKQQIPRATTFSYGNHPSDLPDYTHKQDEKDTPTSDVSVDISNEKVRPIDENTPQKTFSFHVNAKPIDAKQEAVSSNFDSVTDRDEENNNTEKQTETPDPTESTTTQKTEPTSGSKGQRPRIKTKYDNNRPRFSVKDYRNRMSSTTTTEKSTEAHVPKIRFPQRRPPYVENKNVEADNSTEAARKKFTPKDPRHKASEKDETKNENEASTDRTRSATKQKTSYSTEISVTESVTPKMSARIRNGQRRDPNKQKNYKDDNSETQNQNPVHLRRPGQRKKVKPDDSISEPSEDFLVTEANDNLDQQRETTTSERYKSESAIMKIAKDDKKHPPNTESSDHISEHSKRVSDLTLAASKDYNTPGVFKTVSPNSRRIPNYFTIATDDPILPIEAFFPQLNQKKEMS